jgi:hypothetical protein
VLIKNFLEAEGVVLNSFLQNELKLLHHEYFLALLPGKQLDVGTPTDRYQCSNLKAGRGGLKKYPK